MNPKEDYIHKTREKLGIARDNLETVLHNPNATDGELRKAENEVYSLSKELEEIVYG